jgi:hypothetical protein
MASSDGKLILDLESRIDSDGKTYYIAKLRAPITIDCSQGVAFLVFTSNEGQESLQVSEITVPKKDTK